MCSAKVEKGVIEHKLSSWKEFADFIVEHHSNCPALIYRGQAHSDWKVESTLDRLEHRFPSKRNYSGGIPDDFDCTPVSRETHLRAFKDAVRGKRGQNPPELSEDEWWALAQHHGLATPMLDWTYSPFVALFFAFECKKCIDPSSGTWREPEYRAVYVLSSSCIAEKAKEGDPAPLPFSPRGETSYRLINQAALFLRMPEDSDLESYIHEHFRDDTASEENFHARAILQKIIIGNKDRTDCLKFLNKMNINRMSLFPDLDGAASYVNDLWELDFDTSLGYISDQLA
ncbi:MAG: FRG domain-containing protein [Phycisphaerae bacterium]|nr:FRG domain-containing protein [Phycisphaerae bacterium]